MALQELPFRGSPDKKDSLQEQTETRIYRTTSIATDLPVAGAFAASVSASFPLEWIVKSVDAVFEGYNNGDVNTSVHIITVVAGPRTSGVFSPETGSSTFRNTEGFDTIPEKAIRKGATSADDKSYEIPRLIYRKTKYTDKKISTEEVLNAGDPVTPLISRIGKVNSAAGDPFEGAELGKWRCIGLSSRKVTNKLWSYSAEYKYSSQFLDPDDDQIKDVTWAGIDANVKYETGVIGI